MASIRAPQHTTLRWQLTATHLAVTGLVLLLLQALSAGLVVAFLVASGRPLAVSLAAVGPSLPGMLLLSTLLFLVGGSVTALLYGQIASRPLARRIARLAAASTTLAQGDLSQRVDDPAADELGQLAREFNAMAARLTTHVATLEALAEEQTRLAVVEERQRVAHDLHDGVTQSLFSLTLLAATARATLLDDRAVAASALDALDQELEQVLRETRSVIFALQPVALSQLPLGEALRALARTAPQRLGIQIDLSIRGEGTVPPAVEHELLRISVRCSSGWHVVGRARTSRPTW